MRAFPIAARPRGPWTRHLFVARAGVLLPALALSALLLPLAACGPASAEPRPRPTALAPASPPLVAHRGSLQEHILLSGALTAARAAELTVPRTPSFQLQIRWIEEEGSLVKAGQKVVEFDNSSFTAELEEKRLKEAQAKSDLEQKIAEAKSGEADKVFAVEEKQADVAKTRLKAVIPQELLSLRDYQDNQLAYQKAQTELAKAQDDLKAQQKESADDIGLQRIELDKAEREIRTALGSIEALSLKAPRDGVLLIADHPWEGRKLREGDTVWVGLRVATLPDLASLEVAAALSDVDDGRVTPGMEAVAVLDAYPGTAWSGKVVEVSPIASELARSPLLRYFPVRVALDRVDTARMRPGMSVRVEVRGKEQRDALLAPRAALELGAEPARALLAGGGSVPVTLGGCSAADCVVLSGLREGERLRSRDAVTAGAGAEGKGG